MLTNSLLYWSDSHVITDIALLSFSSGVLMINFHHSIYLDRKKILLLTLTSFPLEARTILLNIQKLFCDKKQRCVIIHSFSIVA